MKIKQIALAAVMAVMLAGSVASSAHAALIAGWDFSQWAGPGFLTTDGENGANTLGANYSNLTPDTQGIVSVTAPQFGTMYINGNFGSSSVDPFSALPQFIPWSTNLTQNENAPVTPPPTPFVPFNSLGALQEEGQFFQNALAMANQTAADVVFSASLLGAQDWSLSFAARTVEATALLLISYSIDGQSYGSETSISLSTAPDTYTVALNPTGGQTFVRFRFAAPVAGQVGQVIVDNVAISGNVSPVPEPSAALLAGLGLACAALSSVRRRLGREV